MNILHAEKLANEALREHGLYDEGWRFQWDKAKVRFGACHYRTRRITLSRALTELNNTLEVYDTILHEVAHALAGARAGHGMTWKILAKDIGAKPERCYSSENVVQPPMRYTGTCPNGHEIKAMRKRRKASSCGRCSRRYNPDYLIVWKENQ